MVRMIEELSLNAWPSLQTLMYDGWVIRFAKGYTKRANSVNPIYRPNIPVDDKIRFCENIYRDAGLPTVFKMTSGVFPPDLDKRLSDLGYYRDSHTSVQTFTMGGQNIAVKFPCHIEEKLTEEWLENYCRMNSVSVDKKEILRQILLNIVPKRVFMTLKHEDVAVGCGMGVVQSGYVGLFDIVIDPRERNKGWGHELVANILLWGKASGAESAYLQVMLNNPPALRLYEKVGFREEYQYWYRVKP